MPYEGSLAGERTVRSVFANTRADGEAFLAEAATIPLRAEVSRHPLTDANRVLADLRGSRVRGTAVLMID
jgi:propanol-preferring alcohol dehydrogenase